VGLISQYNATETSAGPDLMPLLVHRALIQGFYVSDHRDLEADFLRDVSGWLKQGTLTYREDTVDGLEHAPRDFLGLFRGENFSKRIVRVSEDQTRG
jgi:NADPH-dependent curcumin reductase CurA